jgi:capsular exopolysaccharide synthesis family protein
MTDTNKKEVPHEDNIDIRKLLIKTVANWPLFLISLSLAYAVAFLINRYTEPMYSVNASILINEDRKSTSELLINALDKYGSRKNVENEMAVLRSYSMTRKTLKELDFLISYYVVGHVRETRIYNSCMYTVYLDSLKKTTNNYPIYVTVIDDERYLLEIDKLYKIKKVMRFGEPFNHPDFNFIIKLNRRFFKESNDLSNNKYFFIVNDLNSLTNFYRSKLNVSTNEKKTTVVDLSISGPVPGQEAAYLNKLCEVYTKSGLEDKNTAAINTIRFIDFQLTSITDSLRKVELKLQNFKLNNKIMDISTEGTSIFAKIQNFEGNKATLQIQINYYDYLKKYIENKNEYKDIIAPSLMGIAEPEINLMVGNLTALYNQKAVLSYSAQNDNPAVSIIDLQMQKAANALKENINELINASQLNLKKLDDMIADEEIEMQKLPITERLLINIKRDYDLYNNIFTFLLQKRAEAGLAKASNTPDNKVLDAAMPENATLIGPLRTKNYLISMIIGALIPIIILFLTELFNTRLTDLKELDYLKNCNVIGTIGHNEKSSELPVFENPKSALAESFRSLRTNLQYLLREKNEKVILVTSTVSGEGKTFCAMNLATILAMSNKKTLLISLDMRRPKIHKLLNISNDIGLSSFLINRNTKEEIIFPSNVNNLYILTSGPIPPNPAELIETEKMEALMAELKNEYDYIILDTPPVAIVTDALLLSRFSNVTIFVVRQNFSSKEVLDLADELAEKNKMKHINILVNDVSVRGYYGNSYKYGYRYSYGYRYGYNYGSEYYGENNKPPTWKDRIKNWIGV